MLRISEEFGELLDFVFGRHLAISSTQRISRCSGRCLASLTEFGPWFCRSLVFVQPGEANRCLFGCLNTEDLEQDVRLRFDRLQTWVNTRSKHWG